MKCVCILYFNHFIFTSDTLCVLCVCVYFVLYFIFTILVQEIYQAKLIPQEAVPRWYDLGITLGLSFNEINKISVDTVTNERCSQKMLETWKKQFGSAATPDRLIAALQAINLNDYAAQLQNG